MATIDRSQMLTYEMAQRPHHIGVKKAWLTWHSQNLEQFRQTQPYQEKVAQDEIIRRCIRGFFTQYLTVNGNEVFHVEFFIFLGNFSHFYEKFLFVSIGEDLLTLNVMSDQIVFNVKRVVCEISVLSMSRISDKNSNSSSQ
uniref:Uncharacterized protein n=1 Tax=Parascaris equorum TaxID=6256 RepID=A0A914RYB9_PAREQ